MRSGVGAFWKGSRREEWRWLDFFIFLEALVDFEAEEPEDEPEADSWAQS